MAASKEMKMVEGLVDLMVDSRVVWKENKTVDQMVDLTVRWTVD